MFLGILKVFIKTLLDAFNTLFTLNTNEEVGILNEDAKIMDVLKNIMIILLIAIIYIDSMLFINLAKYKNGEKAKFHSNKEKTKASFEERKKQD